MTNLQRRVERRSLGTFCRKKYIIVLEPGDIIGFRAERGRTMYYLPL